MPDDAPEVTLDMDSREVVTAPGIIADAERPQEFNFGRFKIAEHGGVVNPAAGVGVDEADARLEAEGFGVGHLLTMSWRGSGLFRRRGSVSGRGRTRLSGF